jgi:type VI secretion system protein ImpJ
MRSLSRIVWSEGMHLTQHHFQEQSRYFEDLVSFSLANLYFKPYGLAGCQLDAEALLNGTVSVVHARGMMPDGLPFHFPEDPHPEPLAVRELFSPTQDSHLVLLTVPARRPGQANLAETTREGARFTPATALVPDEVTGRDERPVLVARKNFSLRLDSEPQEGWVSLPIARIRRDGSGHFIYDPDYIPPCIQIGASARLMDLLRRLVDRLEEKARSLAEERRTGAHAEHSSREIVNFWLSHVVHASYAPLRHQLQTQSSHPEELYTELARLAGALCTFSLHAHPADLPLYDHDRLDRCFGGLEKEIRQHLEVVRPTNRAVIPLQRVEDTLYHGAVADARVFDRAHWFLGVRSSLGPAEVVSRAPRLVKICSSKFIRRLVQDAFPGLDLEHVAAPPPDISPRFDTQYFSIRREGPCWNSIVDSREIGVFVPAALPGVELELTVMFPG